VRKRSHHSIVTFLLAAGVALGQHPDLQGTWSTSTLTPLERPAEFENKPMLTEAEAVQFAKKLLQQLDRDRRDGGDATDITNCSSIGAAGSPELARRFPVRSSSIRPMGAFRL
jgi:hypothetical protein